MLKTPVSFKGPLGQLEQFFQETAVFKAYKLLKRTGIENWRFNDESQTSYATFPAKDNSNIRVSLDWPIKKELSATCQCQQAKPCQHITALALYNKSKLDLLAPFTQQIKALKNVSETFANWLNQQTFDPFPNMARHRMIYVIEQNEAKEIHIKLFKAYLTQDDKYEVKTELDSSLFFKKLLPKFVSLADQHVLYLMNQLGLIDTHHFKVNNKAHEELLLAMVKTKRCFWKACYRPPIEYSVVKQKPQLTNLAITTDLFYVLPLNQMVHYQLPPQKQVSIKIPPQLNIKPRLELKTSWQELDWQADYLARIDWAAISFVSSGHVFTLAQIADGKVELNQQQIEQIAGYCYQIEKLPSVHAKYEIPVSENFDINDRYVPHNFTAIAPLLMALEKADWDVLIEDSYRLNSQQVSEVYVHVEQQKKALTAGWFDVEVGVKLDGESINLLPYLIKAIKTGAFDSIKDELMIKLDDGQFIDMPKSKVAQILATINELYDEKVLSKNGKLSINQHQLLRLAEIKNDVANDNSQAGLAIEWLGDQQLSAKVSELHAIKSLPTIEPPKGLNATLRPYQLTGVAWLQFLCQHDLHGVLADDMGLGKTLQVLAHLLRLKQQGQLSAPVLIVTPTSLLGNWQAEIEKFTPQLTSLILTGQHRKKQYQKLTKHDVIITSYGVMSRDHKRLGAMTWHSLVLDEAQAIKNRKTQVAKMAKTIPALHRLCISGTPMENHLGEIWSLFDFLMPGFLATEKLFQQLYQWPIEKEQNTEKLSELQTRLAPFILRRTKQEVAKELPDKNEIIKYIELSVKQAEVYESIRLTMSDEIRQAVRNQQANQILIGNALLRLRQVCCHPALLKLNSVVDEVDSAKLNWLEMVLPNLIEEGRKVLIFSSFTSMLRIIADKLDELNIDHLKLTGKTPSHKRTERINAFQAETVPVFLISLKAGGAGINLTAADTVIHFDPWWNPAAEQQASDRAHRIGQDKQVFVYKLITKGTVEEKIHHLQQQKQLLADNLLSQTANISEILNVHQWQDMLSPLK